MTNPSSLPKCGECLGIMANGDLPHEEKDCMFILKARLIHLEQAADRMAEELKNIIHGPKEKPLRAQISCAYMICDDSHEIDIRKVLKAYQSLRAGQEKK